MITSNQLTVTLDVSTMGVTFNSGLTTVNANSYLTNQFVVQPTANLLVNQTMWVVFQSTGGTVTTQELMLAMRTVTPLTETQDVENGTVTPTTATQEYYTQIPQAIMQNPGIWSFSLAIREQDDTSSDTFTQIDTSTVYNFTVLSSLIGAGAGGTTPNTFDIANLYETALGTVNEAQGYAENAQTYAEQAQGYAQELSGAIGEIDGFQQQLDNIVDGTTPVAEALNAQNATTAQTAQTANTANSAQTSATAQFAYEAGKATNDGDGNNIAEKYATNTNLALKQNITDQTLNTTDKTIVGAINENATAIAGLQQDFVNEDHFKGFAQTAEDVQAITANLNDFAYCIATGTIWTYGASGWTNSNEPYPSDATPLSNTTPLQDGTATAGQSTSAARGDHVHPTDTSRASATDLADHVNDLNNPHEVTAAQVGAYVKPSGGIPETDLSTAVQNKLNDTYTLPVASETQLGGVKPVAKTSEMTQNVGIDSAGALWTNGGGIEQNALISRVDALPETVDSSTPDILAVGYEENTQFYLKLSPITALTATPSTISLENMNGSSWSDQTATVTMSGGDGSPYEFSLSRGTIPEELAFTQTSEGNVCTISLTCDANKALISATTYSATLTCTCGTQTVEVPIELLVRSCLTGDTLITMANGTRKRLDEIKVGDKVLSFNPSTGLLQPDLVYSADSHLTKTHDHYDRYEFDDGTVIKVVHRHRFYNVDKQRMLHLDCWEIGDRAFKQNGSTVRLVKAQPHYEDVETLHYTIFTENQNYFANGLLSGNRFTKKLSKGVE